jgi:hypothetical protein
MVMQNDREFVDVILLYFRKDADEPQPVKDQSKFGLAFFFTDKGHWLCRLLLVSTQTHSCDIHIYMVLVT